MTIAEGQGAVGAAIGIPVAVQGIASGTPISVTPSGSGTQAVSIADGSDVAEGAVADAAIAAGAAGTISAKLRSISRDLIANIVLAAGGNTIGTVSVTNAGGFSAPLTITRPANQTPYTANDVVGGALTFPTMGPSAGRIFLTSSQLELDITGIPTGMTSFNLHLYNVTPPSALADNAPFDLPSGDRASYLGFIGVGAPADLGSTLYVETNAINKQLKLAGTSLFGYLVTVGGFTPAANSEVYVATLHSIAV